MQVHFNYKSRIKHESARHRCNDYVRRDLKEVGSKCRDWINLRQNNAHWRAVVNLADNEVYPLVYDTVQTGRILPSFRNLLLIPSCGWTTNQAVLSAFYLLVSLFTLKMDAV
jgi:hypothetical protein